MMYSNILSEEELVALLTREELEIFKAEQQGTVEHELMLSPAHLLLALRELEDTVGRLTARVEQLEDQLALKPSSLEPEILQVDVTEFEDDIAITENPVETQEEGLLEQQTEIQAESYIESEFEPQDVQQINFKTEELEERFEVSEDEKAMLLSSDTVSIVDDADQIIEVDEINELAQMVEAEQLSEAAIDTNISQQESSLISRSARHRERKPSFMSRLLK